MTGAIWQPTPREREDIIETGLTVLGLTVRDLAGYIGVSPSTVRRDRQHYLARCAALRNGNLELWELSSDAYKTAP